MTRHYPPFKEGFIISSLTYCFCVCVSRQKNCSLRNDPEKLTVQPVEFSKPWIPYRTSTIRVICKQVSYIQKLLKTVFLTPNRKKVNIQREVTIENNINTRFNKTELDRNLLMTFFFLFIHFILVFPCLCLIYQFVYISLVNYVFLATFSHFFYFSCKYIL